MKFLEDTNLSVTKQDDVIIVMMTRAEGKVVGAALEAHASANARKSTVKKIAKDWSENAPVFT